MGIPRASLFLCMARCQNPLQTNRDWRGLGSIATVPDHGGFQLVFWQVGKAPGEWIALSHFFLLCALTLELLCRGFAKRHEYHRRAATIDHQDLFSPPCAADLGGAVRPG